MTAQPASAAGYRIVKQRQSCDCGVACLAMIARVSYERARAEFDAAGLATKYPRRPYASNFADLARCARDIGCPLTMRRFMGWTALPAAAIVKVPCVDRPTRHWHWVVAVREGENVAVLDPWSGLIHRLPDITPSEAPHYTPTGNMLVPADR